ncbi:hypothetical protein ILUMI_09742 [Ignelater luminosus]|uniref:Uncharacterized protein n=1 Tax=Ignelater luminosus TaxID=2038154 RepID=A0A8K0D1S8_IGNLU|nr:hypothetical protein ILUMI_09742 [Ignelater luminosus]
MKFSQEELVHMVYLLVEIDRNYLLASQKHPHVERKADVRCFQKLNERFERTEKVECKKQERPKTITNEENEFLVVGSAVEDPNVSMRTITRGIGIPLTSVWRILNRNKFHPFHYQLVQELDQRDFNQRFTFCRWCLEKE